MLLHLIPTRIHGILDYLIGILLIASPWLFGFSHTRTAMLLPVCLGASTIVYSLITDYELGLVPILPMWGHLAVDLFSGILLAASPWLFHFADRITWPHVAFGVAEILVVMITSPIRSGKGMSAVSTPNLGTSSTV